MGKDRLEEYIKDQIFEHQSEVDPDLIWKNIQKKKTKRKPFFWLFFTGSVLVLAVLSIVLLNADLNENEESQKLTVIVQEEIVGDNTIDELETPNPTSEIESLTNNEKIETQKSNEQKEGSGINTKLRPSNLSQRKQVTTQSFVQSSPLENGSSFNGSTSDKLTSRFLNSSRINNQDFSSTTKNSTSSQTEILSNPIAKKLNAKENVDVLSINLLDVLTHGLQAEPRAPIALKNELNVPNKVITKNTNWVSSLGASTSYYKGNRTLTALDSISELLGFREANEKFLEAWGVGLDYNLKHRSGLLVGTGISYHQINDRSILIDENQVLLVPTPEELMGAHAARYTTERIRFNKIRMLDIPFYLGYMISKDKVSYSAKAGVNFNLLTRAKGNIINVEGFKDVELENSFKNSIGLTYEFQLGFHHLLKNDWSIAVHPSYRIYPNSLTNLEEGIEQRYNNIGLKVMLSKSF